jgi:hypothetical protein
MGVIQKLELKTVAFGNRAPQVMGTCCTDFLFFSVVQMV